MIDIHSHGRVVSVKHVMPIQRWFVPALALGMAAIGTSAALLPLTSLLFNHPPRATLGQGIPVIIGLALMGWTFAAIFGRVTSGRETVIDPEKNEVRHIVHRVLAPSTTTVAPLGHIEKIGVFHGGVGFSNYWYVDVVRAKTDGGHIRLAALVKTPPYDKVSDSVMRDVTRIAELLGVDHTH